MNFEQEMLSWVWAGVFSSVPELTITWQGKVFDRYMYMPDKCIQCNKKLKIIIGTGPYLCKQASIILYTIFIFIFVKSGKNAFSKVFVDFKFVDFTCTDKWQ